ncbi:hypothetical protein AB0D71_33730 [Streptomyces avermitilis]|uniref:hypothetical protein n=1 Tax=Streptomyces avermitilis TaxID=33903 RepID=UPI00341048CB
MRSRLLPEFEQLVNLARLREVQEDLNWLRDDVEPGTVPYPYPADLDATLERFLTHAPYLIAASRRAGSKPLAAQDADVLDCFETLLTTLTQSSDDAGSGLEPGGTGEAMAVWLESGEDLVAVVRTATVASSGGPSRPTVSTSTPPKPPAAAAATGRTR